MEQPNERKPMLSEDQVKAICMMPDPCGPNRPEVPDRSMLAGANLIKNFYEAKITSGELITKEEHERLLKEAEDRASFRWSE